MVDAFDSYVGWLVEQSASQLGAEEIGELVDDRVDSMEAGSRLWSLEALEVAPEWDDIRTFAARSPSWVHAPLGDRLRVRRSNTVGLVADSRGDEHDQRDDGKHDQDCYQHVRECAQTQLS